MAKLTEEAKKIIAEASPALIATSSMNGKSHVSIKGSLHVLDNERIIFVDIDSPRTMANLRDNPQLSALVLEPTTGKRCRIWGKAEILTKGEIFNYVMAETGKKAKRLVLVNVGEVEVF